MINLQSSVWNRFKYVRIIDDQFIANLLLSVPVKNFEIRSISDEVMKL